MFYGDLHAKMVELKETLTLFSAKCAVAGSTVRVGNDMGLHPRPEFLTGLCLDGMKTLSENCDYDKGYSEEG